MSKKNATAPTAAEPYNDNALAPTRGVVGDPLAALDLPAEAVACDGLGELDNEDIQIPVLTLNYKGKAKTGRAVSCDSYYDTVDEVVYDSVEAVFVVLHKTNAYTVFNQETEKNDTVCRSWDRVQGTMHDGTIRPCEGCPDAQWYTTTDDKTGKPKRAKNCSVVYNVYGENLATHMPFVTRYKRTSLPVIKTHLRKHHIARRPLPGGGRGNVPLFVYRVKMTGQLAGEKATYALPIVEPQGMLDRESVLRYAAMAKQLVESDMFRKVIEKAEASDTASEAPIDTSFDPNKWADAEGDDFVPAPEDRKAV